MNHARRWGEFLATLVPDRGTWFLGFNDSARFNHAPFFKHSNICVHRDLKFLRGTGLLVKSLVRRRNKYQPCCVRLTVLWVSVLSNKYFKFAPGKSPGKPGRIVSVFSRVCCSYAKLNNECKESILAAEFWYMEKERLQLQRCIFMRCNAYVCSFSPKRVARKMNK